MALIAGILLLLISIAHNIYGEKKQIPDLKKVTSDPIIIGSQRIMVFQGGLILIAVAIVQILSAVGTIALTGFAQYIPVSIVIINLITTLAIASFLHKEILKIIVPQLVIFICIIVLQILSLNK
jgi:hypothetical protein